MFHPMSLFAPADVTVEGELARTPHAITRYGVLHGADVIIKEFLPSCEYYTHEEALVTALARLCVLQHTNLLCCRGVCICAGDVPTHAAWEAGIVNLSEHLDMRGRMPLSEFQDMFVQVLSGLACLHSRGVAHGALTKTNIIVCQLSPRGALLFKLGDAGISRVLRGGAPASMEDDLVAIGSLACDILTQSVLCMGPSPARTSIQQQAPLACVSTLRSTAPGLADWLLTCVYGGASVTAASLLAELESLALPWEERVDVTENKSEPEARMQSLRPAPVKFASSYEVAPDSDVSSTSHGPQPQALALFKLAVQRASQHCQQLHEVCALTTRRLLESSKSVVIDIELAMSHVDAISSDELLALRKLTMSRRKEYDQGEEALDVTAKQLCSWASLLEGAAHYSAVFSGDTDVAIISDLLANDYPLATAHALGFVALLRLPDRLVNSLAAHALYTRKDVSPARSTVKCQRLMGLRGCMDVCVYDRGGVPLQSVSPLDVTVRFSRDTIQPVDAVITSAGTVRVIYQFSVPVLQPIPAIVYVCGAAVPQAVVISQGPSATGRHVRNLRIAHSSGNCGLCVTPDEQFLVYSSYSATHADVTVLSWPAGAVVRTISKGPDGQNMFRNPCGVCATNFRTILVAEDMAKCVHEVTLTGESVRRVGVGVFTEAVLRVDANDDSDVMVVAQGRDEPRNHCLLVFNYASGAFVRRISDFGPTPGHISRCSGLRLVPDSEHVVITESNNARLSVFGLDGTFIRCLGDAAGIQNPTDVIVSSSGEFVVIDFRASRVFVLAFDGAVVVREWELPVRLPGGRMVIRAQWHPRALATVQGKLLVLDQSSDEICVYE